MVSNGRGTRAAGVVIVATTVLVAITMLIVIMVHRIRENIFCQVEAGFWIKYNSSDLTTCPSPVTLNSISYSRIANSVYSIQCFPGRNSTMVVHEPSSLSEANRFFPSTFLSGCDA